MIKSFVGTTVF